VGAKSKQLSIGQEKHPAKSVIHFPLSSLQKLFTRFSINLQTLTNLQHWFSQHLSTPFEPGLSLIKQKPVVFYRPIALGFL
jgi:hypothetical protein